LITIDGSYGEGGGQILRTAVALSALKKEPIKIINIRANRPDPGIKSQHYIAIKSVKELCSAETTGLDVGSYTLTFIPGDVKGGKYKFDIGTAGSMILVFQTCILASLNAKEPVTIKLIGGTDVKWAPTWDYFNNVFIPLLKSLGISINVNLIKRGYYPKGGGEAEITINPGKDFNFLR
jgi:RNA 3'-phosphate cyclase